MNAMCVMNLPAKFFPPNFKCGLSGAQYASTSLSPDKTSLRFMTPRSLCIVGILFEKLQGNGEEPEKTSDPDVDRASGVPVQGEHVPHLPVGDPLHPEIHLT